jgi:hypothetical protein
MAPVQVATSFVRVPEELFEHMVQGLQDANHLMKCMIRALDGETDFMHMRGGIEDLSKKVGALAKEALTGLCRGGFFSVSFVPMGLQYFEPSPSHRRRSSTRIYGYDGFFREPPTPPTEGGDGPGDEGDDGKQKTPHSSQG